MPTYCTYYNTIPYFASSRVQYMMINLVYPLKYYLHCLKAPSELFSAQTGQMADSTTDWTALSLPLCHLSVVFPSGHNAHGHSPALNPTCAHPFQVTTHVSVACEDNTRGTSEAVRYSPLPNPHYHSVPLSRVAIITSRRTKSAPKANISSLPLIWPATQNPLIVGRFKFSSLPCRLMRRRRV